MSFVKLIVVVSLCYAVKAASVSKTVKQGYLVIDMTKRPSCFNIPSNNECPSFTHQIVGTDQTLASFQSALQAVKVQVNTAKFFKGSQQCQDDVREYSCSNTLMKCKTDKTSPFGVQLDFDVTRTKAACNNVTKSCSQEIQDSTIYNCSLIQTNPKEFLTCVSYPASPTDRCPSTNYKYPLALVKFYDKRAKEFQKVQQKFKQAFVSDKCFDEFKNVYCHVMRGPICATNGIIKRMFEINAQDCSAVVNRCIVVPKVKFYVQEVCKLLPDKSATKVDLPIVLPLTPTSNNAGVGQVIGNSGK